MAVWYEPHPVTPERKAELRGRGFVIVDAQFAPDDWKSPDAIQAKTEAAPETEAKPVRRGRPRKAD
jgi:hypothetical protein